MTTKMKGLLKGLRYISQIFDNDDKEPEMQIGFPTDVKHVAHIGWDGPSVNNTPTWMNEFSTNAEPSSGPSHSNSSIGEAKENSAAKLSEEDLSRTGAGIQGKLQMSSSSNSQIESPTKHHSDAPKHSRRHRSSGLSVDSPTRDPSGTTRPSRQHHNSGLGSDSSSLDPSTIPKKSHKKKSKESSGGGSMRPSRSKDGQKSLTADSFSESGFGSRSENELKNSVLEVVQEKGCE